MERMYKFHWDGGYGDLEGLFIADESEVNKIIGKSIYFGDVLGKYSDVHGYLREKDFKIIDINEQTIRMFKKLVGTNICGHNPLDYIEDMDEEE
jgi:hypothetical protein